MEKIRKEEDDCYFRSSSSERDTGRFESEGGRKKDESDRI